MDDKKPEIIFNNQGKKMEEVTCKVVFLDKNAPSSSMQTRYRDPQVFSLMYENESLRDKNADLRQELAKIREKNDCYSSSYVLGLLNLDEGVTRRFPKFNDEHKRLLSLIRLVGATSRSRNSHTTSEGWKKAVLCYLLFSTILSDQSVEEIDSLYDREGLPSNWEGSVVKTAKELWTLFDFASHEARPCFDRSQYHDYVRLVSKLYRNGRTLNTAAEEIPFFEFTGAIHTDARLLGEQAEHFSGNPVNVFLLQLLFLIEMLIQFPFLLELPAEKVTTFMTHLRTISLHQVETEALKFAEEIVEMSTRQASHPAVAFTLSPEMRKVLETCRSNPNGCSGNVLQANVKFSSKSKFRKNVLDELLTHGYVASTIKDKPSSPNQKYVLTKAGETVLQQFGAVRSENTPCGGVPPTDPAVPKS